MQEMVASTCRTMMTLSFKSTMSSLPQRKATLSMTSTSPTTKTTPTHSVGKSLDPLNPQVGRPRTPRTHARAFLKAAPSGGRRLKT